MTKQIKFSVWTSNIAILGLYTLLTCIVTYPSFFALFEPMTTIGGFQDTRYFLWHLWWFKKAVLDLQVWPTYTENIYHPLGGIVVLQSPFNEFASLTFYSLLGLTRTYSLLALLSFPLTAFTSYLLCYYLTHNRQVAIVAGLIFAYSTRHYAHATEHIGLWTVQWLPLYILALFLFLDQQSYQRSRLLIASFVLTVMTDYAYFVAYFLFPFTALWLLYFGRHKTFSLGHGRICTLWTWRFWWRFSLTMLIAVLLTAPIYFHLLSSNDPSFLKNYKLLFYSADFLTYFLPAQNHPLWPGTFDALHALIDKHRVEGANYIGVIALLLALLGLFKGGKHQVYFWSLLAILSFIFSLGPLLTYLGEPVEYILEGDIKTYVTLPYIFFLRLPLVDLLRVPSRLSFLVQLSVMAMAAYGLNYVSRRWSTFWRWGGQIIFASLIMFDSLFQFPFPSDSITLRPHPIYQQLLQEKNKLAVLELPFRYASSDLVPVHHVNPNRSQIFYYMYYASFHQHPLVGGAGVRTPTQPIAFMDTAPFIRELMYPRELFHLDEPDIISQTYQGILDYGPRFLRQHNIGYVILHRQTVATKIERQLIEQSLSQALGEPFVADDEVLGFRVPQQPSQGEPQQQTTILGLGWYPKGKQFYNRPVRWMGKKGSLLVFEPKETLRRLSLTMFSPMANFIDLRLKINGSPLETFILAPNPYAPEPRLSRGFVLQQGWNTIQFEVHLETDPQEQIDPRAFLGAYQIDVLSVASLDRPPQHLLEATLGEHIRLIGFDQNTSSLQPGDSLSLMLYWQASALIEESYKVFVHVLDEQGQRFIQTDNIPQNWQLPTPIWSKDEVVADPYTLDIPADMPPGHYQIQVGMYTETDLKRLPVNRAENDMPLDEAADYILLGRIEIKPSSQ